MTREWGQPWSRSAAAPARAGRRRSTGSRRGMVAHRPGAARQRAVPPDRRRRPGGAAPLPARPARPQPGDRADALARADRPGPARTKTIRRGDPIVLARTLLLASHGFTLSAHTMSDPARAGAGRRRVPPRRRARPARAELPRAMSPTRPGSRSAWPASPSRTDVLVIGLGITGAGVALDAASRGLVGGRGRRPRRRLRHQPLELQARARRPALPRQRPVRRRPRERRRARHPDADHGART